MEEHKKYKPYYLESIRNVFNKQMKQYEKIFERIQRCGEVNPSM